MNNEIVSHSNISSPRRPKPNPQGAGYETPVRTTTTASGAVREMRPFQLGEGGEWFCPYCHQPQGSVYGQQCIMCGGQVLPQAYYPASIRINGRSVPVPSGGSGDGPTIREQVASAVDGADQRTIDSTEHGIYGELAGIREVLTIIAERLSASITHFTDLTPEEYGAVVQSMAEFRRRVGITPPSGGSGTGPGDYFKQPHFSINLHLALGEPPVATLRHKVPYSVLRLTAGPGEDVTVFGTPQQLTAIADQLWQAAHPETAEALASIPGDGDLVGLLGEIDKLRPTWRRDYREMGEEEEAVAAPEGASDGSDAWEGAEDYGEPPGSTEEESQS